MWKDPIVDEIHQIRASISQAFDNDLHAIFKATRHGRLSNYAPIEHLDTTQIVSAKQGSAQDSTQAASPSP